MAVAAATTSSQLRRRWRTQSFDEIPTLLLLQWIARHSQQVDVGVTACEASLNVDPFVGLCSLVRRTSRARIT